MTLLGKVQTAYRLGLGNIYRVFFYRITVTLGINFVNRLNSVQAKAPFFYAPRSVCIAGAPAVSSWREFGLLFSYWPLKIGSNPPDWFYNFFSKQRFQGYDREWWKIADFEVGSGDIKCIWEISRFDWVLAFAQRARQGDMVALNHLNEWLNNWSECNPPYLGPNWKCGQEASIRVMHLAIAALILRQINMPAAGLVNLLRAHLQRIYPTIQYAIAQNNNHGISEAAALFIGGSWLHTLGEPDGKNWMTTGRKWLENQTTKLVGENGTFSQYSINYHRVMLDTLCIVEVWRRNLNLRKFSEKWIERTKVAAEWLRHLVIQNNGDVPNIGANDGARLLQLADTNYRDFRPTVQLSTALFFNKRAYSAFGPWNNGLIWLGVDLPSTVTDPPGSYLADDGGFAILRKREIMVVMRYPRFRFRPGQSDALHVDLWVGSKNLLCDAGSYGYNVDAKLMTYFGGTSSHNTVQFDNRDQMPRYSRFLLVDWLQVEELDSIINDGSKVHFGVGYVDSRGARHKRSLTLDANALKVHDQLSGFKEKAVIRWRLPFSCCITQNTENSIEIGVANDPSLRLKVIASSPISRGELVMGWKSLHYLQKDPVSVLEVEILQSGNVFTEFVWSK